MEVFCPMEELNQSGYGIESPNEPHMACVLLLDTSSSMSGAAIQSLNAGINSFKSQTALDETAQRRVDIAIIEFNSTAQVVQEFTPISAMQPVSLSARGCTSIGAGVNLAIDKVKERNRFYNQMGTPCFKPWIFMITDGEPTDDIEYAVQRVQEEERKGTHGKLKFWSLAVQGANENTLRRFSERVMKLQGFDFTGIFNWMSESMVAISVSRVGDNISMTAELPQNVVPASW